MLVKHLTRPRDPPLGPVPLCWRDWLRGFSCAIPRRAEMHLLPLPMCAPDSSPPRESGDLGASSLELDSSGRLLATPLCVDTGPHRTFEGLRVVRAEGMARAPLIAAAPVLPVLPLGSEWLLGRALAPPLAVTSLISGRLSRDALLRGALPLALPALAGEQAADAWGLKEPDALEGEALGSLSETERAWSGELSRKSAAFSRDIARCKRPDPLRCPAPVDSRGTRGEGWGWGALPMEGDRMLGRDEGLSTLCSARGDPDSGSDLGEKPGRTRQGPCATLPWPRSDFDSPPRPVPWDWRQPRKVLSPKPSDRRGISELRDFWEELLPILAWPWLPSLAAVLVSYSMAGELRAMRPSCEGRLGATGGLPLRAAPLRSPSSNPPSPSSCNAPCRSLRQRSQLGCSLTAWDISPAPVPSMAGGCRETSQAAGLLAVQLSEMGGKATIFSGARPPRRKGRASLA